MKQDKNQITLDFSAGLDEKETAATVLEKLEKIVTLQELLEFLGFDGVNIPSYGRRKSVLTLNDKTYYSYEQGNYFDVSENSFSPSYGLSSKLSLNVMRFNNAHRAKQSKFSHDENVQFLYFAKNGEAVSFSIGLVSQNEIVLDRYEYEPLDRIAGTTFDFTIKNAKKVTKLTGYHRLAQSSEEVFGILKKINPYCASWIEGDNNYDLTYQEAAYFLIYPELEQLIKSGFAFAGQIIKNRRSTSSDIAAYNRNINVGEKSLNKIFKINKRLYNHIKDYDISIFDTCRKLKNAGFNDDSIVALFGVNGIDFKKAYPILKTTYEDKPIFTVKSFVNYLRRLDTYEAIESYEALTYISDYISICKKLNMKPRFDTGSLKREHDVAARLYREKAVYECDEKIRERYVEYQPLSYSNSTYMIRPIKDSDDLFDEARAQHNCVACYQNAIANGRSKIFVMRRIKAPEKSLITIELDKQNELKQAFLGYNTAITDKNQKKFISKWLDYVHKYC